jgi:hypothetical protein
VLLGHSYGGLYTQMYAPGTPTRLWAWPWSTLRILSNSRALQKGGRCTNGPGVRAGSKTPSPRLGCVRCESVLLAGGGGAFLCMMFL